MEQPKKGSQFPLLAVCRRMTCPKPAIEHYCSSDWDHDAGSADIIRQTGAKYMVMHGDVPVVQSGATADFAYPDRH